MLELHRLSYATLPISSFLKFPDRVTESRRLEVRCGLKSKDQARKVYVHMLNGTLCATERALCCVVENYQTPEVSVPQFSPNTSLIPSSRVWLFLNRSDRTCKGGISYLSSESSPRHCRKNGLEREVVWEGERVNPLRSEALIMYYFNILVTRRS